MISIIYLIFQYFAPPQVKSWLIGKDPDAGKEWRQEEKGTTEDEMVGWHHWLKRHEFEQALEDGEGQGSLACCSPWGHKESDTTEQLNYNNNLLFQLALCNFGQQTAKCSGHEHIPLDSLMPEQEHQGHIAADLYFGFTMYQLCNLG